jgi:hypothetical protein
MAIAVRCEACQVEAIAAAPDQLRAFLDVHRNPGACAERAGAGTELAMWLRLPAQLPRSA